MKDKNILKLLTPSWLSGFIGGSVALLITISTVILNQYQGSELQQQIFENQANVRNGVTTSSAYDTISANVANNSFLGSLPLLLTWAAVGLVVYFFAAALARSFGQAADLRDELQYVHTSRQALLRQAFLNLVIRIVAVIGWFVLIKASTAIFIPYALAAASLADTLNVQSIGYGLLAIVLLFVLVQVHAIFLRLIVLRPRVFSH